MALVPMKELLQDARARKYAVGGFNVFNFETLGAVVEVAEELKSPIVLGLPERVFKFTDVETLSAAMARAAEKSPVPIALHLDHGQTFEGIMKAIRWGFTSVMFDGSALSFDENVRKTKEITKIAHSLGITVEGELGYFGSYPHNGEGKEATMIPLETATDFVTKTKIDALAVAAGHNGKQHGKAIVDYGRIGELGTTLNVPLVLHGGSKLGKQEFQQLIQAGITKINIATDMTVAAADCIKAELARNPNTNFVSLMGTVKKGLKDSVRKYMLSFNCIGKAH